MALDSYTALCAEVPSSSAGMPIQVQGSDDVEPWRFVVQMALPGADEDAWGPGRAVWGPGRATWGGGKVWVDVSCRLRGATWNRGSDGPGERFKVGVASVELDNADNALNRWSDAVPEGARPTAAPKWYAAGTLVRLGVLRPANDDLERDLAWYPMFTGLVETWQNLTTAYDSDQRVRLTLAETLSTLATIDANAAAAEGSGDTATERFERLLDRSEWAFGRDIVPLVTLDGSWHGYQATEFALNRLAECYLTADSCWSMFYSGRDGSAVVRQREFGQADITASGRPFYILGDNQHTYAEATADMIAYRDFLFPSDEPDVIEIPYSPDPPPQFSSDIATVRNVLNYARVGGTARPEAVAEASIARHGRREHSRFDLPLSTDGAVDFLLLYDIYTLTTPSGLPHEQVELTVHLAAGLSADMVRDIMRFYVDVEPGQVVPVWNRTPAATATNRNFLHMILESETHSVEGTGAGLRWDAAFTLSSKRPWISGPSYDIEES